MKCHVPDHHMPALSSRGLLVRGSLSLMGWETHYLFWFILCGVKPRNLQLQASDEQVHMVGATGVLSLPKLCTQASALCAICTLDCGDGSEPRA